MTSIAPFPPENHDRVPAPHAAKTGEEPPEAEVSLGTWTIRLQPPFAADGGFSWRTHLPPELLPESDELHYPERSPWRLIEDGVAIGVPHALHGDIRERGEGAFSHWTDTLYFATSDNSDPNTNGRRYELCRYADGPKSTVKARPFEWVPAIAMASPSAAELLGLADILRRRQVREVVYFHTDHFEPWVGTADQQWRALERFAQLTRDSGFGRKLSLFFTPLVQFSLANPEREQEYVACDRDGVAFWRRPPQVAQQCQRLLRPLEGEIGHEFHIHIHHENWTRTGLANPTHDVAAWANQHSTPEADSSRFDLFVRLCRETMQEDLGRPVDNWGFVHGNWALNASDRQFCQIENEIEVLRHHGCFGDFTFPAPNLPCQPTLIEYPYTCRVISGTKPYDSPQSDPRPISLGGDLIGPDRFFIWNSPIKAQFSSLDFFNEDNRKLYKDAEFLVHTWLEQSVVVDGRLYVKTHAHSLCPDYRAWEPDAQIPHTYPDTVKVFELLQKVCDYAAVPFTPATVGEVMHRLQNPEQAEPDRTEAAAADVGSAEPAPSVATPPAAAAGKTLSTSHDAVMPSGPGTQVEACSGLIAVFGAADSGSGLVNAVLGAHPLVFGGGELDRLIDTQSRPMCAVCHAECKFWTAEARASITLDDLYHQVSRMSGRPFVVDISSSREWYREALRHFPAVPVVRVLLVKHPVRHVSAIVKKREARGSSPQSADWDHALRELRAVYEGFTLPGEPDPAINANPGEERTPIDFVLRYEDFAASPATALQPILAGLGLEYYPQMEAWARTEHHPLGEDFRRRVQIGHEMPPAEAANKGLQGGILLDNTYSDIFDLETIETILQDPDAVWMRKRFSYGVAKGVRMQSSSNVGSPVTLGTPAGRGDEPGDDRQSGTPGALADPAMRSVKEATSPAPPGDRPEHAVVPLQPPFAPWRDLGDHCWHVFLPLELEAEGDDNSNPTRSSWQLFENNVPIGGPHAQHRLIGESGGGVYSHWQGSLYFSTSDNSDPNRNGRRYTLERVAPVTRSDDRAGAAARSDQIPNLDGRCKPSVPFEVRTREIAEMLGEAPRHLQVFLKAAGTIDPASVTELQRRYAAELRDFDPTWQYKYIDIAYWIGHKAVHAVRFDLDRRPPITILDLGTGAGHFPAVCRALGHTVIGTDVEDPFYSTVCAALAVDRRTSRLAPRRHLDDLGTRFNLVTGFAILFHVIDQARERYWSLDDWAFFFQDLFDNQLKFPARIFLEVNRRPDGNYDLELLRWIESKGASVDYRDGLIDLDAAAYRSDFLPGGASPPDTTELPKTSEEGPNALPAEGDTSVAPRSPAEAVLDAEILSFLGAELPGEGPHETSMDIWYRTLYLERHSGFAPYGDFIANFLERRRGQFNRLTEIGAGIGQNCIQFAARGWKTIAIESESVAYHRMEHLLDRIALVHPEVRARIEPRCSAYPQGVEGYFDAHTVACVFGLCAEFDAATERAAIDSLRLAGAVILDLRVFFRHREGQEEQDALAKEIESLGFKPPIALWDSAHVADFYPLRFVYFERSSQPSERPTPEIAAHIYLEPPFSSVGGFAWTVELPESLVAECDDNDNHYRSPWRLVEDGRRIGTPHALHDEISDRGQGRHSHWNGVLYFSSSDNTDPNGNGRQYGLVRIRA